MRMNRCAFLAVLMAASAARAVTIPTVPVGNPGNAGDVQSQGTFGSIAYPYRIGQHEVTNAQYTVFLNAVAASDPYGLYNTEMDSSTWGGIVRTGSSGSFSYDVKQDAVGQGPGGSDYTYADKPVVFVSWYDSIRFANWLHNGQGSGDTENGAYTLLGRAPTPSNGDSITRNPGARWWLPSEDEWYKAAYHQNDGVTGNYWQYPTGTNSVPNNNLPANDTGNSANFFDGIYYTTGNFSYPMTDAGAYTLSGSPYGTFDQGGNVSEWNEALISSFFRGLRGGSWLNDSGVLRASLRSIGDPTFESIGIGFRVASIPEPSSVALLTLAAPALLRRRSRKATAPLIGPGVR